MEEAIAKIFNDNLGNRITLELGQGMYNAVMNAYKSEMEKDETSAPEMPEMPEMPEI